MSGHDDTSVPPAREDAELPPHPPRHVPPHFGQGATGQPSAAHHTADTPPGAEAVPGSSVASDAEETMTPPLHDRTGGPPPGAQPPGPASYDPTASPETAGAPNTPPPFTAGPYQAGEPPYGPFTAESPAPEAERTVTDEPGHEVPMSGRPVAFVNGQ